MSDILTISPFEHGSYSHVLHAGLTDRLTRINLADPAVCGDFIVVPPHTAFIAYRRMLAIAPAAADGWDAENFEVFIGNRDFEVRANSRSGADRDITWVRGEHEGVKYELNCSGSAPVISRVECWGLKPPNSPSEEERLREKLRRKSQCAVKAATQCISHRIFRYIPAGCLVRQGFRDVLMYMNNPDFDKAIQAMHFLDMMEVDDKSAWIRKRLRPITQIRV